MCDHCNWEKFLDKCQSIVEEKDVPIIEDIYIYVETNQHISEKQKAVVLKYEL